MILDAVIDDVVIDDIAFSVLTFNVEKAATPGALSLILETVRVDRDSILEVMVDPEREEKDIDEAFMVEPVRDDKERVEVVIEVVAMVDPWMVLTVMAGARTFRRPRKLARPDAILLQSFIL